MARLEIPVTTGRHMVDRIVARLAKSGVLLDPAPVMDEKTGAVVAWVVESGLLTEEDCDVIRWACAKREAGLLPRTVKACWDDAEKDPELGLFGNPSRDRKP